MTETTRDAKERLPRELYELAVSAAGEMNGPSSVIQLLQTGR
jgi:hypothetical protein